MDNFFLIIIIIFSILNIILFFKIWGMTTNIKQLKNFYMHENGIVHDTSKTVAGHFADKEGNKIDIK